VAPRTFAGDDGQSGTGTLIVDAFEVHVPKANYGLTMIRDGVVVELKE
jgi:hypothetical protein